MRTLIRQKRRTGREVTEWLSVIDEFDQLVADRADLERLIDAAVGLTGRRAGVLDALNGRLCVASPDAPAAVVEPPGEDARVITTLTATRLRGRETGIVDVGGAEVVAASVDDAGGRIGACWLDQGAGTLAPTRRTRRAAVVVGRRDQQRAAPRRAGDAEPAGLRRSRAAALDADDRRGGRRSGPTGRPPSGPVVHGPRRAPATGRECRPGGPGADAVTKPRTGGPQLPMQCHRPVCGDRRRGQRDDRRDPRRRRDHACRAWV